MNASLTITDMILVGYHIDGTDEFVTIAASKRMTCSLIPIFDLPKKQRKSKHSQKYLDEKVTNNI